MDKKIIIYSVLPRLWGNLKANPKPHGSLQHNGSGRLSAFDTEALDYIKGLGCTHIWFVGLLEHATTTTFEGIEADPQEIVKGCAGSPYAVKDYYDIAPALADHPRARMAELEALVERVHGAGLKVLMDFVPNHVARTYRSDAAPTGTPDLGEGDDTRLHFSTSNCFYYFPDQALVMPTAGSYTEVPARATGNDCFSPYPSAHDWYETIKINYGVDYLGGGHLHTDPIPVAWHRMLEILSYWVSKGIDGFRCDMAEMVPEAFWAWAIPQLRAQATGLLFLAEIYQPYRYRGYLEAGFDYLYDKVGVYDTLRGIVRGELPASAFDNARDAVGADQASMCYFLENHDEQRFASDFYAGSATALRPALAIIALCGRNPLLIYFAQELGERGMDAEGFSGLDGRTSIFDYWSLASLRRLGRDYRGKRLEPSERATLDYHRQLLALCHSQHALRYGAYHGLNYLQPASYDGHRLLSFVRYIDGEVVLVVANLAHEPRKASIHTPSHLIELIGLAPNTPLRQTDLLHGTSSVATLTPLAPLVLEVGALDVRIVRLEAMP